MPPQRFSLPERYTYPAGTVEWGKHKAQVLILLDILNKVIQHYISIWTENYNLEAAKLNQFYTYSLYDFHTRAISDLHMRLTGNDKKLKAKFLSTVKACIETHHPDFLGDHQHVKQTVTCTYMLIRIIVWLAFNLVVLHSFSSRMPISSWWFACLIWKRRASFCEATGLHTHAQ